MSNTAPGSWTYTPPPAFAGADSFTYAIGDGRGGSATGTVTVTVSAATAGLVAAYSFNEGSGTAVTDRSGNGRNGTIRGAQFVAGESGMALRFDGVDDWVTVPDGVTGSALDLTTGMTLSAWVNPSEFTGWETVVMKERGAGALAYALYAHDGGSIRGGFDAPAGTVHVGLDDQADPRHIAGALARLDAPRHDLRRRHAADLRQRRAHREPRPGRRHRRQQRRRCGSAATTRGPASSSTGSSTRSASTTARSPPPRSRPT